MQNEELKKLPVCPVLRAMEIGEVKSWPLLQTNAVRSSAQTLGLMLNKKWVTHVNHESGTIDVTRIS